MTRSPALLTLCACFALTGLPGCGDVEVPETQIVELNVRAVFGDAAFECGTSYEGVGRGAQTYTPRDARMYVHDVELLRDGEAFALILAEDGAFQTRDVVLLDFEDATGACSNGTPQTNTRIRGVAPAGDYDGVRFKVGVPAFLNHANQAQAPSPLNISGMWWSWKNGYKHMKFDGTTEALPDGVLFHLGSNLCTGDNEEAVCANENTPTITLNGWTGQDILLDLGRLFQDAHLDADEGGAPGCMSGPTDPDCAPIFDALGIPFADNQASDAQAFVLADE